MNNQIILKQIRLLIILFVTLLALSGITAFPIETELRFLIHNKNIFPESFANWLQTVTDAVKDTNYRYPFLSYGTDWLAFAHICIAIAFYGAYKNPVLNKWIVQWAMICCVLVLPLAFIAGDIRGIPFFHQLIDCSFGIFGFMLLYFLFRKILLLEKLNSKNQSIL